MRETIILLALLIIFVVDGMIPGHREAAESGNRKEAQVPRQVGKQETTPRNGAPQYTVIWVLPSFGGF